MGLMMAAIGLPTPAGNGNGSSSGSGTLPLGRLTDIVTAVIVVGSWLVALASHVHALGWTPDPLIDLFATISFGAVIGRASGIGSALASSAGQLSSTQAAALDTLNKNTDQLVARAELNTALTMAAHDRLDALKAPAAKVDSTGLTVGNPKRTAAHG